MKHTVRIALAALIIAGGMLSTARAYEIEADFAIITVNPAPAQGDATNRLGEAVSAVPTVWDWTSGNLLGWSGSGISGLTAIGGAVTGTGTTASPYIQLTGFSGPDLDFGFYDYLQTRLRLPAGFGGDVVFRFGTSTEGGVTSADREFRIPNARLINDGEWHTYRIDLGLIPRYRDQLTDLRVYPLGSQGSGATFEIDYIEVGDLPGDFLWVNTAINKLTSVPDEDVRSLQSKHAVVWWAEGSGFDPEIHGRRALRMIEESHQVYTKILGYLEPFESWDLWRRDGKRYKVNQVTWYDGFWMGGYAGFGHFNVSWQGLLDEGWGNPVPHEYAHVVQGHQLNFLAGGHWESHANYLRQAWQMHSAYRFPAGQKAQMSLGPLINSNYRQDHGGLIYADFRIHHALESMTDIGLDWNLAARLWYEGQKDATCYTTLAAILPAGYTVADVVTRGLRRWPFLDFEHGDLLRDQHWRTANDKAWHDYITGSLLIPSQDRPGWWRVPFARAPERFAYMYHELDTTASTVTVELQGVDVMGTSEGWRWSLAAVDTAGNVRYSDVFTPGTRSMTLQPGETKVYLIVVATPTNNDLNLEWTDNRLPTDRHLDRLRYPYEVRIVGATPAKRQLNWNTATGSIHPNGGGWKADTATVHSTAYVGPNARVLGSAQVRDNARIEDYAVVAETAIVRDNAVVSGYAVVRGSARVNHNARVRDRAVVTGSVQVRDNAMMTEYAHPSGSLTVRENAIVRGQTTAYAGNISGHAILDYDVSTGDNFNNGVQFAHVPWGGWYVDYWWMTKAKPRGLVASYRVDETQGQILWDEFGVAHGLLRGNAQRVDDAQMFTQVMRLDGTTAYLVLDRNLAAMRSATYSLWVKPNGANTDRAALFMGGASDRYLRVVPRDGDGRARVRITRDGTATEWISQSIVPTGAWTNIAISFDADTGLGTLYVNGQAEDLRATTLLPEDVLGPNDYVEGEALYVGRDWDGNLFAGDVVDLRVFNVALSDQEIETSVLRSGSCIGAFFTDAPMDFDGSTTEYQSGVIDGLQRVLKATIYPRSSAANAYYEAIFDSSDEVNGTYRGSGFGLRNGRIHVRLANVGFWDTGVNVTMNQWQTVMLTYNGSRARLYVNGVQRATRTYSANESHVAGKNFRIGFAQSASSGNPKYYFNGEIRDAFIYDNVDVALQSAPAAPASIVYPASSATGQYTVDWAAADRATIYQLDRSADGGSTWTQVYWGAATSYGEAVGSGSYRYRVRAENIAGSSAWRTGTTDCVVTMPPPPAPESLIQPPYSTTGLFSLNWDPVGEAEGYEVQRSADGGTTWATVYTGAETAFEERAVTVTPSTYVSVNFDIPDANTGPYQPEDVGGVIQLANWNNVNGRANSVPAGGLVTSAGQIADGLSMEWIHTVMESWNTGAGGDIGVYGDFVRLGGNELRILGAPRTYDLILYAQDWGNENPMSLTVNGVTRTGQNTTTNQSFPQDGYIENDNYFVFGNLSGTATVTLDNNRQFGGFQMTLHGATTVNDGAYRYRVRSVNYAGNSAWLTGDTDVLVGTPETPVAPEFITYPEESETGLYPVSWAASPWAASYQLERSGDAGLSWVTRYSGADTSFDEDAADGVYRYRVRALNEVGTSDWRTGTTECTVGNPLPPDTPESIDYPTGSDTGVYLVSWTAVDGAENYELERSADAGGTWTSVYAGAGTSFDEDIGDGAYRYRVRARNDIGDSAWRTGDTDCVVAIPVPPQAPESITYPAGSDTGVYTVSWTAAGGAESYEVERSEDAGDTWVEAYTGSDTSFEDTVPDGTYRYRVRALNEAGSSAWRTGDTDCVVAIPVPPEVPESITYPADSDTGVYLVSWTAADGAESYEVERSADAGATWEAVYAGADTSFEDTVGDGTYRYRVRAINEAGASAWRTGETDCVVAIPVPPEVPESITYPAESDTGRYRVSWTAADGAEHYELERSADAGDIWDAVYAGAETSFGDRVVNGTYRYRVRALNEAGSSDWRTGETDCVVVLSATEEWLREHFEDPGDDELAGLLADPDEDDVVNLMEFALRGDPMDGQSWKVLPSAGRDQGGKILYRFRVRHMDGQFAGDGYIADGLLYQVLRSAGPGAGEEVLHPFTEEDITWAVDADGTPVLEVAVDREAPVAIGFFKLNVSMMDAEG